MSSTSPFVTIVIPVYNEEGSIGTSLERLTTFFTETAFPYAYRITVVDNASTDRTSTLVTAFAVQHPEVTLLTLSTKGKGGAIRRGWAHAQGDILTFMDADLSSDIGAFRALVDALIVGGADLSIGNRLGKRSQIVSTKRFRKIASRIYNSVARLFLHTKVDDHQCGFKAITRKSYDILEPELTENGFFIDTELIALARKHGLAIHQEDIVWIDVPTSKVSLVSDSFKMFVSIVKLSLRLHL